MKHLKLTLSLSLILFTFLGGIPKITAAPTVPTRGTGDASEEQAALTL